MVHAFVMARTGTGTADALRERLLDVAGVAAAHVVAGNYDIIMELDGEEMQDILHSVTADVQGLEGVVETKTYICLE